MPHTQYALCERDNEYLRRYRTSVIYLSQSSHGLIATRLQHCCYRGTSLEETRHHRRDFWTPVFVEILVHEDGHQPTVGHIHAISWHNLRRLDASLSSGRENSSAAIHLINVYCLSTFLETRARRQKGSPLHSDSSNFLPIPSDTSFVNESSFSVVTSAKNGTYRLFWS